MPVVLKGKKDTDSEGNDLPQYVDTRDIPAEVIKYLQEIGQMSIISEGLTKEQVQKLTTVVKMYTLGTGATVIQTCSTRCPSYDRCPLAIINKEPRGEICPIESQLYFQLLEDYKRAVAQKISSIESIKDIEQDPIILSLISQAVEIEIFQLRVNALIATAGLVSDVPVLASDNGVEYILQESAASRMKRDLNNRKDKVLRQLLATPEMVQKVRSLSKTTTVTDQKRIVMSRAHQILEQGGQDEPDDEKDDLKKL